MDLLLLEKYAAIAIKVGVNLQPGQPLIINAPITADAFVRSLTKVAYEQGASIVRAEYYDELQSKLRFMYSEESYLEYFPSWRATYMEGYANDGAAVISLLAPNPDLMSDVPPEKLAKVNKGTALAVQGYREVVGKGGVSWLVLAVASPEWAAKVYPELSETDAIAALWDNIFAVTRANTTHPVEAWEAHVNTLQDKVDYLNALNIDYLLFKAPGTDLRVKLPKDYIWEGGGSINTVNQAYFVANIPTEEVFTMPHKYGVDGTLTATMPLSYNGVLIDGFSFTFKDGRIVDFQAEKGYDTLKALLDTDEGARYLGEVALVPVTSPIYQTKRIFFNTLFDENAACHFALGRAYPSTIKNGIHMSPHELSEAGGNNSLIHVDFMVGSEELAVTAITHDGKSIPIFIKGNWA